MVRQILIAMDDEDFQRAKEAKEQLKNARGLSKLNWRDFFKEVTERELK